MKTRRQSPSRWVGLGGPLAILTTAAFAAVACGSDDDGSPGAGDGAGLDGSLASSDGTTSRDGAGASGDGGSTTNDGVGDGASGDGGAPDPGDEPTVPFQLNARAFLDSWGVVGGPDAPGLDAATVAAELKTIGVRRIRAALVQGGKSNLASWQALQTAMTAAGTIKPRLTFDDLITAYNNDLATTWSNQQPLILAAAKAGVLGSVEGPNEMNNVYVGMGTHGVDSTTDETGNWAGANGNVFAWTKAIHDWKAGLSGDDAMAMATVRVFAPTIATGEQSDYQQLPDLSALVDDGTLHFYAGAGRQPSLESPVVNAGVGYFGNIYTWCQAGMTPKERMVLSEYGATTTTLASAGGYGLHSQAAYLLNQMHEAAGIGARQMYVYTFIDPSTGGTGGVEGNYGLFDTDGTAKPIVAALSAVKDLMSLGLDYENAANTDDVLPFTPGYDRSALTVSGISGAFPSGVASAVTFPKSDGSTVISVTDEPQLSDGQGNDVTVATVTATVNLGSTQSWHLYDPFSATPLASVASGKSATVPVPLQGYPKYLVLDPPTK